MEEKKFEEEERERFSKILEDRINIHDDSREAAQEKLHEICEELRAQVDTIDEEACRELDEKFTAEDNRLQTVLIELNSSEGETISKIIQKAKAELLVAQTYDVIEKEEVERKGNEEGSFDLSSLYELKIERHVVPEAVKLLKPTNVRVSKTSKGELSLQFTRLGPDEMKNLSENGDETPIKYKCLLTKKGENKDKEYPLREYYGDSFAFTPDSLEAGATYEVRVKAVLDDKESDWSDETVITDDIELGVPEPSVSVWDPEKLEEERENIQRLLNERINIHDESRNAAHEKLDEFCKKLREQIEVLEDGINSELEEKFTAEDKKLQSILNGLRSSDGEDVQKKIQKAKTALLAKQSYDVVERNPDENGDGKKFSIPFLYKLRTKRKAILK